MEDVPHRDDVGLGEIVGEEVPGGELQSIGEPVAPHVVLEDGLDLREVEAAAGQVRVGEGDLHGEVPLRRKPTSTKLE